MAANAPVYPATLAITPPGDLSRLLIFVKWLLIIPNAIVMFLFAIAAMVVQMIAWWVILFTGKIPPGMHAFILRYIRWSTRVNLYLYLLTDQYPPYNGDPLDTFPLRLDCVRPDRSSRLLLFVRWLLVIPHMIVVALYGWAVGIVTMLAWFAILFTGRYPQGLVPFVEGFFRWNHRVNCYMWMLTDEYPPFSNE